MEKSHSSTSSCIKVGNGEFVTTSMNVSTGVHSGANGSHGDPTSCPPPAHSFADKAHCEPSGMRYFGRCHRPSGMRYFERCHRLPTSSVVAGPLAPVLKHLTLTQDKQARRRWRSSVCTVSTSFSPTSSAHRRPRLGSPAATCTLPLVRHCSATCTLPLVRHVRGEMKDCNRVASSSLA